MPWKETKVVSLRHEFVQFAMVEGSNLSQLCRRFSISRKTGYKWLRRFQEGGDAALADQCRRPHRSPNRTPPPQEEMVLRVRQQHPVWGARKISKRLACDGCLDVPSPSTITAILHRHHGIDPRESAKHHAWQRFQAPGPNDLWQMDFKGHFPVGQGRCHPLTVLDDHSRYALAIEACDNERGETVKKCLVNVFRRFGLPLRILTDNGSPWGTAGSDSPYTPLTAWLMWIGVEVIHGHPYHPQTQGKDERFHRTLQAEVLQSRTLRDLEECQQAFAQWREVYNCQRPHEALSMDVPADRYQVSKREYPDILPPIEYGPADIVRKVQQGGQISFRNQEWLVGKAFRGYPVALRHTIADNVFEIHFCHQKVAQIDLKAYNADG
jgi:transposase InsO family protein